MTTQTVRLKITSPIIKLRVTPRIALGVIGANGIDVTSGGNSLSVALDLLKFQALAAFDPTAEFLPVVTNAGEYNLVSIATLLNNSATIIQIVTGGGDIDVDPRTQLLVMNRAVDINPSNIVLPLASAKIGKLKIVDFKGNCGTFPHTVKTTAPDTFQGALTQWSIAADDASISIDPIVNPATGASIGYAV